MRVFLTKYPKTLGLSGMCSKHCRTHRLVLQFRKTQGIRFRLVRRIGIRIHNGPDRIGLWLGSIINKHHQVGGIGLWLVRSIIDKYHQTRGIRLGFMRRII
jgi:hypothetical protein